jgi:FMN phosphatase YigB (HAD superfamily)
VFYDFDQTIPAIHIFHETGGADDVSNKSDQFFVDAFGGKERITRLKRHFVRLTQTGVKCSIVSDGYTAVIKESLERVNLIDFFDGDAIYGRDSEVMRRFRRAKHEVISEEMRLRHISYEEAIFVDDSQRNIKACAEAKTCRTLHVHEEDGLTEENMVFLEAGLTKK